MLQQHLHQVAQQQI
jgi:hypothetical protein